MQERVNWLLLDQLQQNKEPLFERPKYQGQDNTKYNIKQHIWGDGSGAAG